jgi:hypothetical protein
VRYSIGAEVGRGGMGVVFRGRAPDEKMLGLDPDPGFAVRARQWTRTGKVGAESG